MKNELLEVGDKVTVTSRDVTIGGIPYNGYRTTVREIHRGRKLATVDATNGYEYAVVFMDELEKIDAK